MTERKTRRGNRKRPKTPQAQRGVKKAYRESHKPVSLSVETAKRLEVLMIGRETWDSVIARCVTHTEMAYDRDK